MIVVFSGLPGSGKSTKLARTAINILYRNKAYYEKTGTRRVLWSNMRFSQEFEQEFHGFIQYWWDPAQLVKIRDADLFIDELAAYMDSAQWQNMPLELKRFLQQHRRFGVDIYGAAQDFAQVDKSFRRVTSHLFYMSKVAGSRDISATKPDPKFVWGLVLIKELDPTTYDEQMSKFQGVGLIPKIMLISKDLVSVFDTREEIKLGLYPPLRHVERACERENCQFHKIIHV